MKTTIKGMGCNVEIISICGKYVPARIHADPDSCYPAEYPEVEFEVQSLRGRPNPWLASLMTNDDIARIEQELLEDLE